MGNRAVIIEFGKKEGIYLHWNGGRDSIEPMLYYAKHFLKLELSSVKDTLRKFEFIAACCGFNPDFEEEYTKLDCNNYDNGVYVINKDFEIIERMFVRNGEQKHYNFIDFLVFIDESMPKKFQKGKEFIFKYLASYEVEKETTYQNNEACDTINYDDLQRHLQVGDIIYYRGEFKTIIGKNNKEQEYWVNGQERSKDVFYNYTESYENDSRFKQDSIKDLEALRGNPNSYLHYNYKCDYEGKAVKVLDDNNFRIVNKEKLDDITADFKIRELQEA